MDDLYWMKKAYDLALQAAAQGEVPVGAILVSEDNVCLGSGFNQSIIHADPTAHAEIQAIRQAATTLQNHRLNHTTLYVTLEPCCMCAGAMIHARIQRLVFAARDFKAGAAGSVYNLLSGQELNHKVQIDEGILQHACSELLSAFFAEKRLGS